MSNSTLQYGGNKQGQGAQGSGGGGKQGSAPSSGPQTPGQKDPLGQPLKPGGSQPGGPQGQGGGQEPQSIEEWVEQYDGDQLAEKLEECFIRDTGQIKGDRKPVAESIARYASDFNDDLIEQVRRNAALIPYLMANPNFPQQEAEKLLDPLIEALAGAPDKISSQPERIRGQVAAHVGHAVEAITLSENDKTVPDEIEERLVDIFEANPDEGWGIDSPRRQSAGFALAAIKADRDPQELIDFYTEVARQEQDLGDFPQGLLGLAQLPTELVVQMMDDQPSDDLYSAVAQKKSLIQESPAIRERIREQDFETALAVLTLLAPEEEAGPTFKRLLEVDPAMAGKVFREEEIREKLDSGVFEDTIDLLIDDTRPQTQAVLMDMLQRGGEMVQSALTPERFRRLFDHLQQQSHVSAVKIIEICPDVGREVLTGEDMEPLVTSSKGNVRTQAIILCRELDIDVDEEKLNIDSVFTRRGLASWLQEQVDREGAEDRILNYLDVAEEITGGREKSGDRFHQTVTMAAHMTFQPSHEFAETLDRRWPWAVPDLVRNDSLPEETEEWLWKWGEEYLGELEELIENENELDEEHADFLAKRGIPAVQLSGGLTKWRDQEETDQLGKRFMDLIEATPTSDEHDLGQSLRRQLMKTLLGIQVSDENLLERLYRAGGDDIEVARVIADQQGVSTDLLREIFEDWPDDQEIQQTIASHPDLQNDPEIREKLQYVEDPEVLVNMMFDRQEGQFRLDDGQFRTLWVRLRDVDAEKAARVLEQAPPRAVRELYLEDIMPMLQAKSHDIRAPASLAASEVQTGSPPKPSRSDPNKKGRQP